MKDKDEKIIREIHDQIKYSKVTVFDAIIDISENKSIDVEDIVKMLDDNLLQQLKDECINERKVLSIKPKKNTIDSLFA